MGRSAVSQLFGSGACRPAHRGLAAEDREFTKATLFAAMRLVGLAEIVLSFRMAPSGSVPGRAQILIERRGFTALGDRPAINLAELPKVVTALARDLLADFADGMASHCDASGTLHFDAEAGTILIDYSEQLKSQEICRSSG